ncbi:MAG: LptF/LptG family permease [Brevinematales bacterium]|nr:LptF/LptG family permease [Brevinematales bacterium]
MLKVILNRIVSLIKSFTLKQEYVDLIIEYFKSAINFGRIQRYVIRQFLITFLVSSFSLTILAVVFNLVMDITWFLANPDVLRTKFNYIVLVYVLRGPHLYTYLAPLCMLISISYVVSRMSRNFELVAIVNSGISLRHLFAPFILVTIFLSLLYFIFLDQVVTLAGKESRKIERINVWNDMSFLDNEYLENLKEPIKSQNKLITYTEIGFISRDGRMKDVKIKKFYDDLGNIDFTTRSFEGGLIQYTITASLGVWSNEISNWVLYDVEVIEFDKRTEVISRQRIKEYIPPFRLDNPSFFFPKKYDFMFLTMSEMREEIDKSLGAKFAFEGGNYYRRLVQMLSRPSISFSLLISALISLGFVSVVSRNLTFINMVFNSVIRYVLYFITFLGGVWLGENRILPPVIAVWIPNVTFLSYAIYLNYRVRT